MGNRGYQDLVVWQKAIEFVELVYRATSKFPSDERFGLTTQLRRAAVSIPSNIAEGQGRSGSREFSRFLDIALGSVAEVETQIIISGNLGFLSAESRDSLLTTAAEIGRLLRGLRKSIDASSPN